MIMVFRHFSIMLFLLLVACDRQGGLEGPDESTSLTAEGAIEFVAQSERQLEDMLQKNERMAWVYSNFITEDTERLAAEANERYTRLRVQLSAESARYHRIGNLDAGTLRKLGILRSGITIPAPGDPAKMAEKSEIGARLSRMYSRGQYCYGNGNCLDLGHLSDIMADSRDPDVLLETWNGWREIDSTTNERALRAPGRAGQ